MFEQKDLINAENLVRALKKGKYELDGEEVLAFSDMFKWTAGLVVRIKQELTTQSQKKEVITAAVDAKSSPNTTKPKTKKVVE